MKKKRSLPPRPKPTRPPVGLLLRTLLLASIGVIAASYAIWRYYTMPRPPIVLPRPPPAETSDSGEIPAPELVE